MTFQYSQKVGPGIFVVASDTQCSVTEKREESIDHPSVRTVEHRSKMSLCEKNQILVAHAGEVPRVGGDPAGELAAHLSNSVFDHNNSRDLESLLREWGGKSGYRSGDKFLVVSPHTQHWQLFKLSMPSTVSPDCEVRLSLSHFVSGDERNPAVFGPEFFGVGTESHDLKESIAIAAATIVMAHKLDNRYVGGLQIGYYNNGHWTIRSYDQCKPLRDHLNTTASRQIKELLLDPQHLPL